LKARYKENVGAHYVQADPPGPRLRQVKPGEIIELSEAGFAAVKDKFERVDDEADRRGSSNAPRATG
jgi:hypothetical protein